MTSTSLAKQTSKWIQKLLRVCDGDLAHARRQLAWLKEKIMSDRYGDTNAKTGPLSAKEVIQLDKYVTERVEHHKPLQYILGTQPFCELDIVTRPPVLIPRWETEEWTYKVIHLLRQHLTTSNPLKILDICTGSGCIALALAKHLPKDSTRIIGLDISDQAISLANHNLNVHKQSIQNSVEFQKKDVFDFHPEKEEFNIILSNPPYITHDEYDTLDPDVKIWEDSRALVADEQGTHVHKRIIQVARHCRPYSNVPRLFMEMGGTQQIEPLTKFMKENEFTDISVWKDLADKHRVITGY